MGEIARVVFRFYLRACSSPRHFFSCYWDVKQERNTQPLHSVVARRSRLLDWAVCSDTSSSLCLSSLSSLPTSSSSPVVEVIVVVAPATAVNSSS